MPVCAKRRRHGSRMLDLTRPSKYVGPENGFRGRKVVEEEWSMFRRIVTCGFVLPFLAAMLYAQTGVGQIQGTVSDASRAVIPKASLVLEQIQTNARFQTTSSDVGSFVFPSLKTGDYRLTVTGSNTASTVIALTCSKKRRSKKRKNKAWLSMNIP